MHSVLTPSGHRRLQDMDAGDEVLSRDALTGRVICNRLETRPQWIDRSEFARWWGGKPVAFRFFRINGHFVFSRSQSIWANGFIAHVALLKLGDVIYTERSGFVRVHRIEDVRRDGWWRCDVDGDHSYILDGTLVHNASRFLITAGGSVLWTAINTAIWSGSSGGSTGASVPGAADTVTMDGSSGAGTVTPNFGGTITVQSVVMGAYTGTFDNSVNNNNITVSASGNAFNGSGSGTRNIKLGSATYTVMGSSATWTFATATGLTLSAASANIVLNCSGGLNTFTSSNSLSWGNLILAAASGQTSYRVLGNSLSFNSMTITAPNFLRFGANTTTTISTFSSVGTSSSHIGLGTDTVSTSAALALTTSALAWCAIRDLDFTGSPVATNSFNLGGNSGITINPPRVGVLVNSPSLVA